jgi:CubicO group peptidase (beta-lactamase class C family)
MTVAEFFRREIAQPLKLSACLGALPPEGYRVADIVGFPAAMSAQYQQPSEEVSYKAFNNPPVLFDTLILNSPQWRTAIIPAVNGYAASASLALLFYDLVESAERRRIAIGDEVLSYALQVHAEGYDSVLHTRKRWCLGFQKYGESGSFGAAGLGGSRVVANPRVHLSFAFVTNSMGGFSDSDEILHQLGKVFDIGLV